MSFNDPDCHCESISHSALGPVTDGELLVRAIIAPEHIDEKGCPKPSAFQSVDLMERGLSVLRADKADTAEIDRQADALRKGDQSKWVHCMMIGVAGEVRALRDSKGRKAFCIIDDEMDNQPMHATIMRSADQGRSDIKELRAELMKIFNTTRQPAVADLSRADL